MKEFNKACFVLILLFCCVFFCACKSTTEPVEETHAPDAEPRDTTPQVLVPESSGDITYASDFSVIDASHTDQGYIMVTYTGEAKKVKLQIKTPAENTYTYLLNLSGQYETFPLTAGDGSYNISVYENVVDDMYAMISSQDIDVTISDEFLPYLYPNQYVWFTDSFAAITLASTLSEDCYSDFDVVKNVYHYVIENITYDNDKAATAEYGYLPDIDDTLSTGTGICFDYASLMASMLRSQRIPTRLEVGYADTIYHAWISVYIPEIGWIDNVIEFDGHSWRLMDPTFAADSSEQAMEEYMKDNTHYDAKYYY